MSPTITPLEALRRLIAEVKQLDAVEVGARWNQLQGELGVAEGVVRDDKPSEIWHVQKLRDAAADPMWFERAEVSKSLLIGAANIIEAASARIAILKVEASAAPVAAQPSEPPIAYLRFRAAQQWSGNGNHDIEHNEWLETCHAHEIGDDKLPAFPVYAARQIAAVSAAPSGEVGIVPDWPFCNPGCDYEDPHGSRHDGRSASCGCDAAKASIARQSAAITATKE